MGQDRNLAGAVNKLNNAIAEASALEDARFKKTVKDIKAAKAEAREQVQFAKKEMLVGIAAVQAKAKAVEQKILGDIQDVSAMIVSDKAAQARINKKVDNELDRLVKLSDKNFSESKRARGVLKHIMDENKRIAHEEVMALAKEAKMSLKKTNSMQNAFLAGFKKDLTGATEKLYSTMAANQKQQVEAMAALKGAQAAAIASTAGALKSAEKAWNSRLESLNNAVVANAKSYQRHMEKTTGVVMRWKEASTKDRALIRTERGIMETKSRASIVRAIQLGEAKIKAVEERAMENIATEKKTLLTTISVAVENMADNVFKTVQENRKQTADNYLSLKAYAVAAADKVTDYVQKGKGRNLSSIGDLLQSLAAAKDLKVKEAAGVGFGEKQVPNLFSGANIPVSTSVTKINGLV